MEITNSNPEKIKDPKRVEAGKRLAAISRAAKARKKEQLQSIQEESDDTTSMSTGSIVGVISAVAGVGALYFAYLLYKQDELGEPETADTSSPRPAPVRSEPRMMARRSVLETFD